jgi:hypothetical protein
VKIFNVAIMGMPSEINLGKDSKIGPLFFEALENPPNFIGDSEYEDAHSYI